MLNFVAELRQNAARNIRRILRDKIDADALRANQLYDLLDFIQQSLRCIVKQKVRLVKEKYHLRLLEIARLGELGEQFVQHPEHEGRINGRILNQGSRVQNVDIAPAVGIDSHPVRNLQRRLAEKLRAAFSLEGNESAEYGTGAALADVAVLLPVGIGILLHIAHHGL